MYKIASDKRQSSLHRGKLADWIDGEERLSAEDRLAQLRQNIHTIESRISALPAGSEERKQLGSAKQEVQAEIKALRDARPKAPPNWKEHFVNEAKRLLSPSQFQMIENAAKIEAQREQAKRDLTAAKEAAQASQTQTAVSEKELAASADGVAIGN